MTDPQNRSSMNNRMKKLKIIWFCAAPLRDQDVRNTGTWLGAMARGLLDSDAVELGIIAPGPVNAFTQSDYRQVRQWIFPASTALCRDHLPPRSLVRSIVSAVEDFSPDVVHHWGIENFWGLLSARGLLNFPSVLRMQGAKGEYSKIYCGGLTWREQIGSIGVKEILKRRTMHAGQREFARWGAVEREIMRGHRFVEVESDWIAAIVKNANPDARLFSIDPLLREPFYEDSEGWRCGSKPTFFCTAAYPVPYKGLHVAIRALEILRKTATEARLRIAGTHQRPGVRQDGYVRWLNRMIEQKGLTGAIDWLGPLDAGRIVEEIKDAAATVIPTYIESSCAAMQEAMYLGCPVVISYVGGLPSIGRDEENCLFFPPGDELMCAHRMERLLVDRKLALRLSQESRKLAVVRNDRRKNVEKQLEIYRQVADGRTY
jgi:glycosyltransferase involved in cell wall biosynthesis